MKLEDMQTIVAEAPHPRLYARGRFLSLAPDNTGMGGTLHTNHVANFAEPDDCAAVAAVMNHADALLELWRASAHLLRSVEAKTPAGYRAAIDDIERAISSLEALP